MKLKTLKDLEQYTYLIDPNDIDFKKLKVDLRLDIKEIGSVKVKELKQEMIKWINLLKCGDYKRLLIELPEELTIEYLGKDEGISHCMSASQVLMHIFNIKEVDLK